MIPCSACEGRGDFLVVQTQVELTASGGGSYAYPTYIPCGRCRGRREIEEVS